MSSSGGILNNIIDCLNNMNYFKAFDYFREFKKLTKIINRPALQTLVSIADMKILLRNMADNIETIVYYDLDNIIHNMKQYVNITIRKCIVVLNGLMYLFETTHTNIHDLDDIPPFSITSHHTNLRSYANLGYLYGFISLLVANELIFINYNCGEKCDDAHLKLNEKQCSNIFFHTMDGKLSGTGSNTIVFRNQSLFDIEYDYNYELIARILYTTISHKQLSDSEKITYIRKNTNKITNLLNVFIMSFRPTLFTKFYCIQKILQNDYKLRLCNNPSDETIYIDVSKGFAKYRCANEKNVCQYLSHAIHNNHLPHIMSYITNISCDAKNTKLNDVRLNCGSLKECFGINKLDDYVYELLIQEHIGKNSMTMKDFIKYSDDDTIQTNDIAAIVVQFAYTTYVMNYILGISHSDIHIENIYVEKHWRIRANDYVIMFGKLMKKIYDIFATPEYRNKDIFKNCRESPTDAKWEINNDGLKGILNIQSRYHINIIDFDRALFTYGGFDESTYHNDTPLNPSTERLIKTLYTDTQTSWGEIYKHNIPQLLDEYQHSTNKFFIYKDLPQSYSDELYKINKRFGCDKLFRLADKLSDHYTWGDVVTAGGMLEFLPSMQHKYDFVGLFVRIGFTVWTYIPKDINEELERKYKMPIEQLVESESVNVKIDIQKRNTKLTSIANKWYPVLKYILGLNDTIDEMAKRFGVDHRMKFKHMFERGYINQLCVNAKSPTDILFKDVFVNTTFIGSCFASNIHKTTAGIGETKMYAIHHTQISRHKIPHTSTVFTPPDVTTEEAQKAISNSIQNSDIKYINRVAPQLLSDLQIQTIISNILPENLDKITDIPLVQY